MAGDISPCVQSALTADPSSSWTHPSAEVSRQKQTQSPGSKANIIYSTLAHKNKADTEKVRIYFPAVNLVVNSSSGFYLNK